MGCGCNKNKQQWEVVATTGKVLFTSASKGTADTVAKRYPESTVREKAATPPNELWEVVGQSGSVLYTGVRTSADTVAGRHPESTVRKKEPAPK